MRGRDRPWSKGPRPSPCSSLGYVRGRASAGRVGESQTTNLFFAANHTIQTHNPNPAHQEKAKPGNPRNMSPRGNTRRTGRCEKMRGNTTGVPCFFVFLVFLASLRGALALLSQTVQKTDVGRFSCMLDGVFKPISQKNFAEWPTGRPARKIALNTPKAQPSKGATAMCGILRITRTS